MTFELLSKKFYSVYDRYKDDIKTAGAIVFAPWTVPRVGDREGDFEAPHVKKVIEHFYGHIGLQLPESIDELVLVGGLDNRFLPWEELFTEGYQKQSVVFANPDRHDQRVIIAYHALLRDVSRHSPEIVDARTAQVLLEHLADDGYLIVQNGLREKGTDEYLLRTLKDLKTTHFYADTFTRVYQK